MKKIIKALLLSAVILGTTVGCQETNSSTSASSNIPSSDTSSISESRTSSSPFSSDTTSSISSSSTSSSVAPTLTGITLDTANVKKSYEQGESLDLTGLVVTANYSDNTNEVVNNYTTNPANGTKLDTIGAIPVTVAYKTATTSFTVIVARPSKKAWTEQETKIMSDYLYGYVLPFTGSEAAVVAYDAENDAVTIKGGPADNNTLASYANKVLADGFTNVNPNGYVYEKTVTVQAGTRHLRVAFANIDGAFYLEAYDPYYYTFPATFVLETVSATFGSTEVPPAFSADYYEVDSADLGIYCYTNDTNALSTYTSALETAQWDIKDELNNGYKVAVSPDGKYCINYAYNTEYKSLDIYFGPLSYWNNKVIEDFYNKYNGYVVDIPAFNVANGQYIFKESNVNEQAYAYEAYEAIHAFMYVYGATEQDLANYAYLLKTNDWDVEKDGNTYYAYLTIANKGVARFEFEYSAKYNAAIVTIYYKLDPIPVVDWPADDIAALLGEYTIGTVPAYTGANKGFVVLNDMFGIGVLVKVQKGTEEAAIESYKTDLANAGYTNYDEEARVYTNPNSEIAIEVYSAEKGSVTIAFAKTGKTKVFPSSLISSYFLGSDAVPALEGANEYAYKFTGEEDIQIACVYDAADAASNAQGQYVTLLQEAKYTFNSSVERFVSKNNQFQIYFLAKDNVLTINIHGTPKTAFVSLWPTAKINQLFFAEGYTDELPSYDKVCDDITAGRNYDNSLYVLIEANDKANVKTEYCSLLASANFTYDYANSNEYDSVYKSPNNQYSATVSTNSLGVSIIIKPLGGGQQGGDTFPAETIYGYFPTAEGVLPILADTNASFTGEYDDYYNSYSVKVTFATEALATAAYDTYINQLKTANFRERSVWGGYATIYYSPDNSFIVWPMDDYLSSGEIYIDIYPGNTSYFPAE